MIEYKLNKSEMRANIRTLRLAGFKFDRHALDVSISKIEQLWYYYDEQRQCIATLVVFVESRKLCWWRKYPDNSGRYPALSVPALQQGGALVNGVGE